MKWVKFQELQDKHSFIANELQKWCDVRHRKEFVRTKVGFIAFRRFETLDLNAKSLSIGTSLKNHYRNLATEPYSAAEYHIVFYAEGESNESRLREVTPNVGAGSIQAHIDDVQKWHENAEDFRGQRIVWERVVKETISGTSSGGITRIDFEIYLFPQGYGFKCAAPQPLRPVDHAALAYMEGGNMPPIIPGTVRS